MKNSSILIAPKELSDCAAPISYQNRLSFWFHFFLRRELKIAKEAQGIIKPYFPKVRNKKDNQLLLTGPLSSDMDSTSGASNA